MGYANHLAWPERAESDRSPETAGKCSRICNYKLHLIVTVVGIFRNQKVIVKINHYNPAYRNRG